MNADSVQILVVSSREDRVQDLKALLTEADFGASHLVWCDSLDEALECLSTGTIDITVVNGLDDHFTLEICIRLAKDAPYVPIVLWIPSSEEHIAENAFAHGVTDILILGQTSPRQIARNLRHAHWRNLYAKRNHHLRLRAQTVIDALPEIIGFKDKEGRYIAVNRAFERHTQRTEADILGKRDIELFDESIARNHMWSDQLALERNNMVRVKQVHPNPDGSMRHYETTKICMPNPDGRGVALVNPG